MSSSAKKRTEVMVAEDRAKVCRLLTMGYRSKTEIASIINESREPEFHVTPKQISHDIEYMKNKFMETGIEDFKIYRGQILDELDLLMKTYWRGYEQSRRNKISIESNFVTEEEDYENVLNEGLGLQSGEKIFQRAANIKEEVRLEGNPAFLQGVQACIDRRAKIFGVDAPNKFAMTDVSGTKDAEDVLGFLKGKIDELAVKTEGREEHVEEPKLLNE